MECPDAPAERLEQVPRRPPYQMLGENYAGIRRWAPAFLDAFVFQGVPAAAALIRAIDMLRDMNRRTLPSLPKSAPIGFIRERWDPHPHTAPRPRSARPHRGMAAADATRNCSSQRASCLDSCRR